MRQVLIASPCYDGKVDANYASSLFALARMDLGDIALGLRFQSYDAMVHRARNDILKYGIEGGYDDLIFIDIDQPFAPQAVLRLLSHQVSLVGFPVKKKEEQDTYNVRIAEGNHSLRGPLLKVDSVGTGFLRMDRYAMEEAWEAGIPYSDTIDGPQDKRWVFGTGPVDGVIFGEDVMLCAVLKERGIDCWVDVAYTCAHMGHRIWTGDFLNWLGLKSSDTTSPGSARSPSTPPQKSHPPR